MYRARVKKLLLCIGLAITFVGADCSTPSGLTRSCSGAAVQNLKFSVVGSCGGSGTIELSVPNAGQCAITVLEGSSLAMAGLPTVGMFGESAGATSYNLAAGGWTLQAMTNGMIGDNAGLQCTADAPVGGVIPLSCNITACSQVGEDLEPTCSISGTCTMHLTPASLDAAISSPSLDAGGGGVDAATPKDATTPEDVSVPKDATAG